MNAFGADRSAIVAGAGIAGLTAALALSRAGYAVRIFERARTLEATGAGLQLSPNALAVLDRLGLGDALSKAGVGAQAVTLRSGRSGRVLAQVPVDSDDRGYRALLRADLQAILLEATRRDSRISLELGHELVALDEAEHPGVRAGFDVSGKASVEATAAIFVAADGVHSAATRILECPAPEPSGMAAVRFALDASASPAMSGIEAWLGPQRHVVAYPVNSSGDVNVVAIVPQSEPDMAAFKLWDRSLQELIARGRPLGSWPLLTVDPRPRMGPRANVALIGDAAHAMLPYAAQGAAMAIEDGWMLATCLSATPSIRDGLIEFSKSRTPRIAKVLKRVALHRMVYHLPFPLSLGRDAALAVRSPRSLRDELRWLYDWQPPDFG